MNDLLTIEEIKKAIDNLFREGPPNGWQLGWSKARYFGPITAAAAPYRTTNHTSFDYGFCNWYEVHVDGSDKERYYIMTIKISFVIPVYCMFWTEHENNISGSVIELSPKEFKHIEDSVRCAVKKMGFSEISNEWHEIKISGVHLELGGTENATIGKCLFTDYAG